MPTSLVISSTWQTFLHPFLFPSQKCESWGYRECQTCSNLVSSHCHLPGTSRHSTIVLLLLHKLVQGLLCLTSPGRLQHSQPAYPSPCRKCISVTALWHLRVRARRERGNMVVASYLAHNSNSNSTCWCWEDPAALPIAHMMAHSHLKREFQESQWASSLCGCQAPTWHTGSQALIYTK